MMKNLNTLFLYQLKKFTFLIRMFLIKIFFIWITYILRSFHDNYFYHIMYVCVIQYVSFTKIGIIFPRGF